MLSLKEEMKMKTSMPTLRGRNTTPTVKGQNVMLIIRGRIPIPMLTLVNAGYFFEEIMRGAQTSAPPQIPFIS